MDAVVDGKLTDDLDYASILVKVIGHKLSDSFSGDLYSLCRINFADDLIQTHTPQFMDMGFSTINSLDESGGLNTPATRIQRSMYGSHWSAPDHVFDEEISVVMSEAKSDHDYNYKTGFQFCK